ncbi:MAG: RNase J family beta-CASP ribonuclease [Nanoarchaeota archaeon]|nr:RNase J family beta-CASP ribonuclease [Nanoarchaeota archaeon]
MLEVCTIGGFEEVGKNMTAVKIGEDVIIFDAGIYLPALVEQEEREQQIKNSLEKMRRIGALPNDEVLDKLGWTDKVRAIIIGHAHLDHVGAAPYIATRYPNAEIMGTPFTMKIFESIVKDEELKVKNKIHTIRAGSTHIIKGKSGEYKAEFIHTTHSTIQCVFVVLHTHEGTFFYALDFKFDNYPVIGTPPNYQKLKELGKKGIDVLVVDSLYSGVERKTPSERIARHLLEEAIDMARSKNSALFITTFSSHIARLKSAVEFGRKTNRQIIFLGRSLAKYVQAAREVGECQFYNKIKIIKYKKQVNSFLKRIESERGRYLIVCTGHQAEPGSILDRIVKDETPFHFKSGDNLIFSSSVIPTPTNIASREAMDKKLKKKGVKIQTDVHVSGHGGREDLRYLLEILKPKHIIPAHGSIKQETPMIELAAELGYKSGENSHLTHNGKVLKFDFTHKNRT